MRSSFEVGERVILDIDKGNWSEVEVVEQTTGKLYTRVRSLKSRYEWDVMTYRLSKINK